MGMWWWPKGGLKAGLDGSSAAAPAGGILNAAAASLAPAMTSRPLRTVGVVSGGLDEAGLGGTFTGLSLLLLLLLLCGEGDFPFIFGDTLCGGELALGDVLTSFSYGLKLTGLAAAGTLVASLTMSAGLRLELLALDWAESPLLLLLSSLLLLPVSAPIWEQVWARSWRGLLPLLS